ncbi:hypothetical protein BT93_A0659 [Corymbia citriodora subsp. variegata]|nr:hypothetical protein BT93_A0659 [Corymbia citriodora subsp. variegata]
MLASVLSNLNMDMDPRTNSYKALTELVPLGLVVGEHSDLRQTRHKCITFMKYGVISFHYVNIAGSGLQKYGALYLLLGWGDFRTRSNKCDESKLYEAFYFIVAVIPYGMRFLQCLRRLYDERDMMQGLNGPKYFSTIVVVVMRTGHDLRRGVTWKIIAAASSGVATVASTYWDLVIDWGLLRRNA